MADDDHERISAKAYEIWESEGRPHGRDQAHWDQAKEIVALHDSMGDTLLPRSAGSFEPEEQTQSTEPYGDMPGITDQGRDDLTDIDREPEVTKPSHATYSTGDTAGHVARSKRDEDPDIDDGEVVTPAPKVAAVTPTPSNPTLGVSAPREAVKQDPDLKAPQAVTPKTAEAAPKPSASAPGTGIAPAGNGAATSGITPTPAASPSGAKAPAGMAASSGRAPAEAPAGLPPIATGAGQAPAATDDARLGSGLQASPVGNSTQVTGKSPPKPASAPGPVTRGRSSDRR
ncbi:DUF2934 domain-containing protein [Lichenibacterium dinghuense]|uniref:DUF2934 domain-containing protein n=1 Tax=Lichenibacterium dinghuense TaxID=2895977 RepID=UPI001F16AF04|nr:DUF2934 domain-containing protein [Lichenibacterium sp. 6Y81]